MREKKRKRSREIEIEIEKERQRERERAELRGYKREWLKVRQEKKRFKLECKIKNLITLAYCGYNKLAIQLSKKH